jgi:iron complex outermembrane receptor protein
MRKARGRVICGSTIGLIALATGARAADEPPAPAADDKLQEVVVTGTSIRGAAPVGSNLITVGRDEIEASGAQTLQQVLRSVPAVTGFGNSGQAGFGSADGAGTFAPTIHGLGASASNGTLVLVDGHRLPLSGINHTLADPNVIAPLAIERVEVLPDGASSVYGSDAVAGVLNFITRRRYDGLEGTAQAAFGDGYDTRSASFIYGTSGDVGSVLFTYAYQQRSALSNSDRPFTAADHRVQGGGNFANFNCAPASVSPAAGQPGAGLIFAAPYNGTGIVNNANNSFCDFSGVADLLPDDTRHNVLVKLEREVGDGINLSSDLVYSKETNVGQIVRGSVTANVWGPGSTPAGGAGQINPFFQGPAGVNVETVRFQADQLFGPGAHQNGGAESIFGTFGLDAPIKGTWRVALGATIGQDDSRLRRDGALCVSCALLALNGTTNTGGNTTAPSVPGTTTAVTTLPLTTANALDVWSPASSNQTTAALRSQLLDSTQLQIANQAIRDFNVKFDGSLFSLPGGDVRAAVGAEYIRYRMREELTRERGTGPASTNSFTTFIDLGRNVKSGFVEILVPIVGGDMGMPGLRSLDINLSGRYDDYSDFGNTTNPKYAFTWGITDGLKLRANYARSFTAPALTSRGNEFGVTAESSFGGLTGATASGVNANLSIPNTYPGAIGLPGCTAATPTCLINTASVQGMFLAGGNKDLTAQKGKTYSVGVDFAPEAVSGLRMSATWWHAKYIGAITAPQAAFAIGSPNLNSLLQLFPGGASPAQIAAAAGVLPQTSPLPATVYFIYSFQQRNAFNLDASGVDADFAYRFDTGVGNFNLGLSASRKLKMDESFGTGGESFSVLNTIGINTTFPSTKMQGRASFGWNRGGMAADLFVNYIGDYLNWNGSAPFAVVRNAAFSPVGGGQPVDSYTTLDIHAAYSFQSEGWLSGTQIFVDGNNVLDEEPPFVNAVAGYDPFNANPIGRVVTVGFNKKW